MNEETNARDVTLPQIQMAFACENMTQDPFQRVSFSNVIDQLNAPVLPATIPQIYIVFGFEAHMPGIFSRIHLTMTAPGKTKVIDQGLQDMAFTTDRYLARVISGFGGLTLSEFGRYMIRLTTGERQLGSFTINLRQAAAATGPRPFQQ